MQAIRTRYIGPRNVRGSRIMARSDSGINIVWGYDPAYSSEENHKLACNLLCKKLQWPGAMVGGFFGEDMYWVSVSAPKMVTTL